LARKVSLSHLPDRSLDGINRLASIDNAATLGLGPGNGQETAA
jgi:hypothetical protein